MVCVFWGSYIDFWFVGFVFFFKFNSFLFPTEIKIKVLIFMKNGINMRI